MAAEPGETRVFDLIRERLSLMKEVAAWKMARGRAVEDLAREAVVLDRATEAAVEAGLDGRTVRPFFAAQIAAAKDIQTCWIARWAAGGPVPGEPRDLGTEIRPDLIRIGAELTTAIAGALSGGPAFGEASLPRFRQAVDVECLSPAARDAIHDALRAVTPE